jgi:hypothetical protein
MNGITPVEPVEIVLDKPRKMKLTFGALFRAEQALNEARKLTGQEQVSIFNVINTELQKVGENGITIHADFIVILLWASLSDDDPSLTLDQTKALCINPIGVIVKLMECVNRCFTKTDFGTA